MKNILLSAIFICFGIIPFYSQSKNSLYTPKPYVELTHPEWSKNATIYEVNIRQYTKEGTFRAFEKNIPRLKNMGVDILWLMPIHPIGEKNRKGSLGSYYSVKDFKGVNPDFGTLEDLKHLVNTAHSKGMKVILDWVGNHSAWDNPLAQQHPDWYTKSREGQFHPTPWYDWDDVIDFDYNNPNLRKYMTEAMGYWMKVADIDGFRCDVAGFIPVDFWDTARKELDKIKPVFLLAEWESRDLHKNAFDMTYAWTLWDKMKDAVVKQNISGLVEYMAHDVNAFPYNAYRMTFTDNHDMNSWNGTQYSNFGPALDAAIVMTGVVNGMPLCYSGQEAGLDRSLKFFEKDSIDWKPNKNADTFTTLFQLKHKNQALWNGKYGGEMVRIYSDKMDKIISFSREKNGDKVLPIINFSKDNVTVTLKTDYDKGNYTELFTNKKITLKGQDVFTLKPYEYLVLVKN